MATILGQAIVSGGASLDATTAKASDILNGKTAYDGDSAEMITGTMRVCTTSDLEVDGASVSGPVGYYENGVSKTVKLASASTLQLNPSFDTAKGTVDFIAVNSQPDGYTEGGESTKTLTYPAIQAKTVEPSEDEEVTAIEENSFASGTIKVGKISSTHVGKGIPTRTTEDLTAVGGEVKVPAGYYPNESSKAVATGTHADVALTKAYDETTQRLNITATHTQDVGYIASKDTKTASDYINKGSLSVNGNVVTTTAGYYNEEESAVLEVKDHAAPTISQEYADGKLTITASHSQVEGYVRDTSASTASLEIAGKDESNISFDENVVTVGSGYYNTNTTKSMTPVTHDAPTASGALDTSGSTHYYTVTPSHTQTKGYVKDSTAKTGTPVKIKAVNAGTITPTELEQTVVAAGVYTEAAAKVAAIPSNYVGSGIERKSTLNVVGGEVTADPGYYAEGASASVAAGTHVKPALSSSFEDNKLTITATHTQDVGYISAQDTKTDTLEINKATLSVQDNGYTVKTTPGYYDEAETISVHTEDHVSPGLSTVYDSTTKKLTITASHAQPVAGYVSDTSTKTATKTIDGKVSGDLSVKGATVTAPAGYYDTAASVSVTTTTHPAPTATGQLDTTNHKYKVTPSHTQTEGYVVAGSKDGTAVEITSVQGATVTPTESEQTAVPAARYTEGAIKVAAIPTTYVGSGIARKTSDDLSASGATITAPAGYYANDASASVASGSVATSFTDSGMSTYFNSGTSSSKDVTITPKYTNTAGYVAAHSTATNNGGTGYYKIKNASLNNSASTGVTYTEDTSSATVIPSEGALYINSGWMPNTKITLGHMIPDPETGKENAGAAEMRSGYVAYDGAGKKITGTMPDVSPAFTGGVASLTGTSNSITTNMATSTLETDYYINAKAKAKATRTAVTYNGAVSGYVNKSSGTTASGENTSAEGEIDADKVYVVASTTGAAATSTTSPAAVSLGYNQQSTIGAGYYPSARIIRNGISSTSASKSGGTVSWGTGYITSGSETVTRSDLGITDRTKDDLTVDGNTVTAPAGYYGTAASKSVSSGVLSASDSSVSGNSFTPTLTYDSTNDVFNYGGSANATGTAYAKASTAGYVTSSNNVSKSLSATVSATGTLAKVATGATISGTTTKQPAIARSAVGITGVTDAASGAATTTAPTSGVYVKVSSPANTGTLTATPKVTTAGYGTTSYYGATAATATVGASASAATYVPITTATPAFDGGALSKGTASGGGLSGGGLTAGTGEVSVSNGTVTPSIGGTVTSATGFGVTTTKPSGTDGTNYLTLDPGASVTTNGTAKGRGSVSRAAVTRAKFSQGVTRAAVLYNGAVNGWVAKADNAEALAKDSTGVTVELAADSTTIGATSGTSNWSDASSTNPSIAAGTNYYVPVVTASATGGTASASASIAKDPAASTTASSASVTFTGDIGTTTKPSGTEGTNYWAVSASASSGSASASSGYSTASASATGGSASVGTGITKGASASGTASGNKSATSTEKTASSAAKTASATRYLTKATVSSSVSGTAPTVTISKSASGFTASSTATSYYVDVSGNSNSQTYTSKYIVSAAGYTPTVSATNSGTATVTASVSGAGKVYIPTSSWTAAGGGINNKAATAAGTNVGLATSDTYSCGITVVPTGKAGRAAVTYTNATTGILAAASSATTFSAAVSQTSWTGTTYYVNSLTIPSGKTFGNASNKGAITINGNAYVTLASGGKIYLHDEVTGNDWVVSADSTGTILTVA